MPTDNSTAFSPQDLTRTEDQNKVFPNAQGQVVPAIESAPEEPQDWKTPMAEPEGGWQQEGTPLTIQARPKEVNKILNSKHVIEGMDLTDPDEAAVFVANFLGSKHNADKNEIYNDYELNTKVYGLSGTDPVADAKSILDGDTKTHESSQTRIAKDRKVIAEGLDRLEPEESSFVGQRVRALASGAGGSLWSGLSGFADMAKSDINRFKEFAGNVTGIEAPEPKKAGRDVLGMASEFAADVAEVSPDSFGVSPETRETFTGQLAEGGGQLIGQAAIGGVSPTASIALMAGQMEQEARSDAEETFGKKYEDFTMLEMARFEDMKGLYILGGTALEKVGVMGTFKKLFKLNKTVSTTALVKEFGLMKFGKEFTKGFLVEGGTEAAQGQLKEGLAAHFYDSERKLWTGEQFNKRMMEFAVGGFLGGGFRGGISATTDASKALDKFMNPVEGMSAVDMALAYNVIPEPEFNIYIEEQFGDQTTEEGVPLQELAKKARQGDRKAAEELVAATTVEASQAAVEAGLTPEESEARGKEAAEVADPVEPLVETAIDKEISTKKEELAALEEAEDSTPEDMKSYEKLDKEIQALETKRVEEIVKGKIMTPFTRGIEAEQKRVEQARLDKEDKDLEEQDQVIDLINILTPLSAGSEVRNEANLAEGGPAIIQGWKDAGFSKKEIEVKSKELMTAEGMPNTRLEDVVVRGSQKSTKTDGSPIKSIIKLFKGANPFTVVEEFAHAEYDREIAEGTVTVEQVREWRKAIEEITDTPDLRGETDEDIKEWVAEQVKARIYGQRNNLSLPESFLKFLDDIISGFKQILGRAKELQDLEASGQLPTDFLEMLDRQGLIGKPAGSKVGVEGQPTEGGQTADETFSLEAVDANRAVAETVYLRNSQKFQDKLKDGSIRPQTPISAFVGKSVYFHAPDFAMAGTASVDGEQYAEGKGGVYYPVVFSDGTNFWASTRKAAEQMAKDLNKIGEKNDGKILMGLVTSPAEKMFSSTTMSRASVDFFNVIAKNPKKYGIKKADLNRLIVNASKAARDKDKAFTSKLKKSDNLGVNVKGIKEMMNPDDSTFGLRKSFVENLAAEVSEFMKTQSIESNTALAGALLGSDNLFAKNAIRKGKLSKASVMQGLGEQLSESFTKDLYDMGGEVNKKMVYAMIEYDGRVEAVESDQHESYPYAIQGIDGGEVVVNVLDKAHKLQDIVQYSEDVEFKKKGKVDSTAKAGESVSDTDMDRVMPPSAGITMKPLKVVEPKEGSVSTDLPSYSLEAPDTPAFKEWFGDSKVVDENGEPMVVYHGTNADFDAFEPSTDGLLGKGVYLTPYESESEAYGKRIIPVYVSIKNPFTIKGRKDLPSVTKGFTESLIEKGYDGIITEDDSGVNTIVAFEPNQIKSATGNRGTFDAADPRINYSLEPLSEQDADAEATVAAEERQSRTPERQAFIDYQRELRRTQLDNTEEEKEKLQKLLQLATDADEIAELKQAGDEKIIRVVEQKVKQIRKQAAEREDVTESVKALERLINSPEVPMEVRARMRGYGRLAERKTPQGKARWVEQMANKLEAEIDRHYRTRNVRALRSFLRPFATQYAPNRRKVRELKGEDARFELEFAQRLLNNSEATPPVGMKDARRDELIDIFGDVGNRQSSPTRVAAALEIARGISGDGRKVREEFEQDRRERNAAVGGQVVAQVLNTEDALDDTSITANERDQWGITKAFKSVASLMIRGMEGFQQQLNKLDRIKGGVLETMFLSAAHNAHQTELAMNIEHAEQTRDDFATVLGPDNRVAAKWYKGSHEVHQTDIEWINNKKVGMVKRKLSKQQGVSLLMQWLDPSLRPTFANMGINEATIEQVKEFIGEIGVSEAYYFREKYAEMGIKLNAKHMEIEGIPLDMIDGYGGRARRQGAKTKEEDMQMFARNSAGRPTVKSGSMKERTNSNDYLMFMDADLDFTAHAKEVNHYISHAELARNLTAAFLTNEDARNAIKQKHGSKFYKSLADQVETIIAGRPTLTDTQKFWTKSRALLTKGTLMVKPAIMFKQLTSAPAFIEEIGPVAYSKAGTAMMKPENLAKFLPMIWGSEYVKNRKSTSQYADIQQSLDARQNVMKGMRISDWVMMNVKVGDIGAVIMGGAPVYYHAYTEAKAANMTDDQAQAKAEEVFGLAAERAQQSSAGHAQGSFLKGQGLVRSWFMYQTSPLQYQRNVNTSIANFVAQAYEWKNDRPSEAKKAAIQAVRAISIYHFILPQIFQAVASGLVGFTDDEDYIKEKFWARQRRAAYLGNLNTFPALGTLLSGLANIISGADETFRSSGSPIIDIFTKTSGQFNTAVKNGDDMDAWINLGAELAQARGIPAKTTMSYYEAIMDISEGNTENPFLRANGWTKFALFED